MSSKFPWVDAPRLYPRGLQRLYPDISVAAAGGGGGGGALWSPYSLGTQLLMWLNPSCISGNSGDQIGTWSDITANANHGTQVTSTARAKLRPNFINSIQVLDFTASAIQNYVLPNALLEASSEAAMYTMVAVKSDPPTLFNSGLYRIQNGPDYNHYPYTDSTIYDGFASSARKTVGNPTEDLRSFHLVNMVSKSGYYSFTIDARSKMSTTVNSFRVTSGDYYYGLGLVSTAYANAYQSDVILVSGALSSSDNSKMEGFILHKHGLQSFLPNSAGHPYANSPPANWSPGSLGTDVVFWFDANSTPGNSGDLIEVWSNFSTAGSHAYQVTSAKRPSIVTSYFNGRNVVIFPGSQSFNLTLELYSLQPTAAAIYEIKRSDINSGTVAGGRVVGNHFFGASSEAFPANHYPWSDGQVYDGTFSRLRKTTGDMSQDLRSMHLNAIYSASGDFKMMINAKSAYATATNSPAYGAEPRIGHSDRLASINSHYFYGQINQLIIVKTALSSADNAKMEGYMMHAAGLQSQLVQDTAHPYINSPPT